MPRKTQTRNEQLIDNWIANCGYICPGWNRPAHKAHPQFNKLTIDHIRPRSRGGTDDPSNLQVLCRKCNSSKKDRPNQPKPEIISGPTFPHPLKNRRQ